MANEDGPADRTVMPATRNVTAEGAFDVAAPKIEVEDRSSYGSRFAHDEHHAAHPDSEATTAAPRPRPWDLARVGRTAASALVGAGVQRLVWRITRRPRRASMIGMFGATVVAIGLGTWLAARR